MPRKKQKTFEQAMQTLQEIIENLESGESTLEESIEQYKQGMDLAGQCMQTLQQAEQIVYLYEQEGYKKLEGDEIK